MGSVLLIGPETEPITTEDAKSQLRVLESWDDAHIRMLITVARQYVEGRARTCLMPQTWMDVLDFFPIPTHRGDIPFLYPQKAPVQSVTEVAYYDTTFSRVVFPSALYQLDLTRSPARLLPAYNKLVWPVVAPNKINSVEVTYVCGYASADLVPAELKMAILIIVHDLHQNRGSNLDGGPSQKATFAADVFIDQFRMARL